MGSEPRIILNGVDDVGRRKAQRDALVSRVEASDAEFGFLWNIAKGVAKGAAGAAKIGAKGVSKIAGKDDKKGSSGDFVEAEHPRGDDGRFVEAPAGDIPSEDQQEETKSKIEETDRALKALKAKQWQAEKTVWEEREIKKSNAKIKKINNGEMKKAQAELKKARDFLKRPDLTDEQLENGTKDFQRASNKVKSVQAKIHKIKPAPFKKPQPK